jgi:hypothetical protein
MTGALVEDADNVSFKPGNFLDSLAIIAKPCICLEYFQDISIKYIFCIRPRIGYHVVFPGLWVEHVVYQ